MLLLGRSACPGDQRPGFAQTKMEMSKQTLALANSELDVVFAFDPGRQGLTVPEIDIHAGSARVITQSTTDLPHLLFRQSRRPARALPFLQAGEPSFFKTMHPVFDRSWRVAQ